MLGAEVSRKREVRSLLQAVVQVQPLGRPGLAAAKSHPALLLARPENAGPSVMEAPSARKLTSLWVGSAGRLEVFVFFFFFPKSLCKDFQGAENNTSGVSKFPLFVEPKAQPWERGPGVEDSLLAGWSGVSLEPPGTCTCVM